MQEAFAPGAPTARNVYTLSRSKVKEEKSCPLHKSHRTFGKLLNLSLMVLINAD